MRRTEEDKAKLAEEFFLQGYACSQAILLAFAGDIGLDELTAKKIASTFGGGMGRLRKTCGALTGSFMVIGMLYGNTKAGDLETKLKSYGLVQEMAKQFEEQHGTLCCGDLLAQHVSPEQVQGREHHRKICHRLVQDAARILADIVRDEEGRKK